MSKRRSLRNKSNQLLFNASLDQKRLKNASCFGHVTKSTYIPQHSRNTIGSLGETNLKDYYKEKTFNKNISNFRQSFNQNDPSQLPFMSSLRSKDRNNSCSAINNGNTICQPFEAGEKTTINMKFRKNITDLCGKSKRMSSAYYRWHNKSGTGNKQATNFECILRDYNKSLTPNPEETNFNNVLKKMKYNDVEPKIYSQNQLICPRQKRLFKVKMMA